MASGEGLSLPPRAERAVGGRRSAIPRWWRWRGGVSGGLLVRWHFGWHHGGVGWGAGR